MSTTKIQILSILTALLAVTAMSAVPPKQTFIGVITDIMCANADHSQM